MSDPFAARLIRLKRDLLEAAQKGNVPAQARLHLLDLMGEHATIGDAKAAYRARHEHDIPRAGTP